MNEYILIGWNVRSGVSKTGSSYSFATVTLGMPTRSFTSSNFSLDAYGFEPHSYRLSDEALSQISSLSCLERVSISFMPNTRANSSNPDDAVICTSILMAPKIVDISNKDLKSTDKDLVKLA